MCPTAVDNFKSVNNFAKTFMNNQIKCLVRNFVKKIPPLKGLMSEIDALRQKCGHFPLGHFYSPVPDLEEIKRNEDKIWKDASTKLQYLNLNTDEQLRLFQEFKEYYNELPFTARKIDNLRYYFENEFYSYSDAIFLYCMIRKVRPERIIEIGSGYSSCVMMDTNDLYFNNSIELTFIDPYPELLISLMRETDKIKCSVISKNLQDCELNKFNMLKENDVLFVDSTHVSKVGSDVNHILFEILPRLNKGVYIHFHDIFYPFEYPKEWIYSGRFWNENYILRAFLQHNDSFEITFFNTFLELFYREKFEKDMPLCLKNTGASLWIKKIK